MSDETVINFPGETRLETPIPKVLAHAAGANLTDCVVIGWDKEGDLFFSSSSPSGPEVLWLIEQAKKSLMGVYDDE